MVLITYSTIKYLNPYNMPEKDKKTSKEKKIDRLSKERQSELRNEGLDKPIDIGPLTAERKSRIDAEAQAGIEGNLLTGLQKIQALRQPPVIDTPTYPEQKDVTIKDVRQQRRAKTADVLTALGRGLKGKEVNPTRYRDLLKDERLKEYQQYRESATSAKKRLDEWQSSYIDEQLDYLNKKYKDPYTSDLQKIELEKAMARLEYEKNRAKLAGQKPDKYDTVTYQTSEGEKITRQVPSGGKDLTKQIEQDKELKKQIEPIDAKINEYTNGISKLEKDLERYSLMEELSDFDMTNMSFIQKSINNLRQNIKDLEAKKESLNKGEIKPEMKQEINNQPNTETNQSDFLNIVNKYKK